MQTIKPIVSTFDIGFKQVQLYRFHVTRNADGEMECNRDEDVNNIKTYPDYWEVVEGYLVCKQAIQLHNNVFFVHVCDWELFLDEKYCIKVSSNVSKMLQSNVSSFSSDLCDLISSYCTNDKEEKTLIVDENDCLKLDALIYDMSLQTRMEQFLMNAYSRCVWVKELDTKTGNMNILPLKSITMKLKPVTQRSNRRYVFLDTTIAPNFSLDSATADNLPELSQGCFLLVIGLNFSGLRDYTINPNYGGRKLINAVFEMESPPFDRVTALRIGCGPMLVTVGNICSGYRFQNYSCVYYP